MRWAWRTHAATAGRVRSASASRPELVVVRLTTPAQVSAWVAGPLLASAYRRPQLPGGCAPGPGGCAPGPGGGPQDPDGG